MAIKEIYEKAAGIYNQYVKKHLKLIGMVVLLPIAAYLFTLYWSGWFNLKPPEFEDAEALRTFTRSRLIYQICSVVFALLTALVGYWVVSNVSKKLKPNTHFYTIMSFVLGFLGLGLGYALVGIAPFYPKGEKTVLLIDMYHQYAPFFIDLKDRLFSGEGFLYSNNVGMGVSYLPQFAYYLASPFNIIAMLFPKDDMTTAIALIEVLKAAASAAAFSLFLRGVFKRNDWSVTALSLMYALSAFTISYIWCIMWFDCLVFLPLAALGLYKLLKEGKYLLYCVSLALTLLSNFYLGFMVCLCMILYFITLVLQEKLELKAVAKKCARFVLGSAIGGGLSAFLVLPTYMALQLTSSAGEKLPTVWSNQMELIRLFGQQLFGHPDGVGLDDSFPNIYCGVIILILLPVYLAHKRIPLRQKLIDLGFAGVMLASINLNIPNLLWHGGHGPNSLPYRFAFVYIFAIMIIISRAVFAIREAKPKHVWVGFGSAALLILLVEMAKLYGENDFEHIYLSLFFIVLYAVLLLMLARKRYSQKTTASLLALLLMFELLSNSIYGVKWVEDNNHYAMKEGFYGNYQAVSHAVSSIEARDPQAEYRIGQLPNSFLNNATYSYRGMTSFASTTPHSTVKLFDKLGYANNGVNSVIYNSFTPVTDSMVGMKYLMLDSFIPDHPQLKHIETVEGGQSPVYIYENRYALPLGFAAGLQLDSWAWQDQNPFEVANDFVRLACGVENVYDILQLEAGENTDSGLEIFSKSGINVSSEGGSGHVQLKAVLPYTGQVFVYGKMGGTTNFNASSEAVENLNISTGETYVSDLSTNNEGTEVLLDIDFTYNAQGMYTIALLNPERFAQAFELMQSTPFEITKASSSKITGTITLEFAQYMLTTIPYDKGWSVKVDSKKAETTAIGGAFTAIKLTPGTHKVELSFAPRGFAAGLFVSVLALGGLLVILYWQRKKKPEPKAESGEETPAEGETEEVPELETEQEDIAD
ncbi:MAG: YfhO family protein [Oscillospiraceae bacterium]|jgi:uncharacterized membrane protein YfhO|nr:YfhO family protein [Oscillospiraceae bacterium]